MPAATLMREGVKHCFLFWVGGCLDAFSAGKFFFALFRFDTIFLFFAPSVLIVGNFSRREPNDERKRGKNFFKSLGDKILLFSAFLLVVLIVLLSWGVVYQDGMNEKYLVMDGVGSLRMMFAST